MIAAFEALDGWMIGGIVLLVVVSLVLALAESTVLRTPRAKAEGLVEEGLRGANRLLEVVSDPERYFNPVLFLLIAAQTLQATLVGVVAGRLFGGVGVAIATLCNIVVMFVLAEAAPKTWAIQHPRRAAIFSAPIISFVGSIAPLRWVSRGLIGLTNVLLPGKGLRRGPWVTEGEILALADIAVEESVLEDDERDLIESIIDFGDTIAREIMVPRTDMVVFDGEFRIVDSIEVAILNGLSRFPVAGDDVDDIRGVVYAKDLMKAERDDQGEADVTTIMRPAYFVPETKKVSELLREMQARRTHIAIVIDEYGGTAGLVTMEDMLEELVGEIEDEFDDDEPIAHLTEHGDVVVSDASINVDDLNDDYGLALPEGDWDSIGGLVFSDLGRVPLPGDVVRVDGYEIEVQEMEGRRVGRMRIHPLRRGIDDADAPSSTQ